MVQHRGFPGGKRRSRCLWRRLHQLHIGGITFQGRTYSRIGYDWTEYVAQIDESRALAIGLVRLDCVPGTMPDIILNNMKFH